MDVKLVVRENVALKVASALAEGSSFGASGEFAFMVFE
jgi:hypothetical protein